ncbi:MAG: Gx transporter family protein [Lachnospiraceae bacterium]|nr:Gx transporter family protein [Lachnospiraceae bacterium]
MSMQLPSSSPAAKRVAISALFASLALIFSYIEAILPAAPGIPGIKLGIANLVVIIAMYRLDSRYALSINLIRIFLAGFMFSGLYGAVYSLCGCILSFAVMCLLKKSDAFSVVGVSMGGGVAHNIGQLSIAAILVSSPQIFYYLPILIISGTVSGILIGWLGWILLEHIPKRLFY